MGLWLDRDPLLLASASVARRLLLEGAGLPVDIQPAGIDERALEASLATAGAEAVAVALARAKAAAVSRLWPSRIVLGADQTLTLNGRALHKPATLAAARAQLEALAGTTHRLDSAAVGMRDGAVLFETADNAALTMRALSPSFLDTYLTAAGSGLCDSVGGYKLEGLGIHLFERIEGTHATILGLPLLGVLAGLRRVAALAV